MRTVNWMAAIAAGTTFLSMCLALWNNEYRLAMAHLNATIWAGMAAIPTYQGASDD